MPWPVRLDISRAVRLGLNQWRTGVKASRQHLIQQQPESSAPEWVSSMRSGAEVGFISALCHGASAHADPQGAGIGVFL